LRQGRPERPNAQIRAESFAVTRVPDGTYDLVIGNVPFGKAVLHHRRHNPAGHAIAESLSADLLPAADPLICLLLGTAGEPGLAACYWRTHAPLEDPNPG